MADISTHYEEVVEGVAAEKGDNITFPLLHQGAHREIEVSKERNFHLIPSIAFVWTLSIA